MKNFKIVFLIVLGLSCNDKENNLKDENIKTLKEINKESKFNAVSYTSLDDIKEILYSSKKRRLKIEKSQK